MNVFDMKLTQMKNKKPRRSTARLNGIECGYLRMNDTRYE